jgi:hypothetical protein
MSAALAQPFVGVILLLKPAPRTARLRHAQSIILTAETVDPKPNICLCTVSNGKNFFYRAR